MTTETTVANVPYWINGRQATPKDARRLPVTNAATGEVVREVPCADATDIDLAVESAKAALAGWRATPPLRRARILMRFRDLLVQHKGQIAAVVTEEHGKTLEDAEGSVQRGLEVVEFATGIPHLL